MPKQWQYQLSVIFAVVNQVIRAIKQIKNGIKIRFFIMGKRIKFFTKTLMFSLRKIIFIRKAAIER